MKNKVLIGRLSLTLICILMCICLAACSTATPGGTPDDGSIESMIERVEKVTSDGLIDTYRIHFTDGTSGVAESVEKVSTVGYTDTYKVNFTDGKSKYFTVKNGENGKDGAPGKDGVGIGKTEINDKGELIITLSNGQIANLGKIVGAAGKDAVTPEFRINQATNMWEVSYDKGATWKEVGSAVSGGGSSDSAICRHEWAGGVCGKCHLKCNHSMYDIENDVCAICGISASAGDDCTHTWEGGQCSACFKICEHPVIDVKANVCLTCGAKALIEPKRIIICTSNNVICNRKYMTEELSLKLSDLLKEYFDESFEELLDKYIINCYTNIAGVTSSSEILSTDKTITESSLIYLEENNGEIPIYTEGALLTTHKLTGLNFNVNLSTLVQKYFNRPLVDILREYKVTVNGETVTSDVLLTPGNTVELFYIGTGKLTLVNNVNTDEGEEGGTYTEEFDPTLKIGEEKALPTLTEKTNGLFRYAFNGWYTDPECTKEITSITPVAKTDYTLYAGWTMYQQIEYKINGEKEMLLDTGHDKSYAPGVTTPKLAVCVRLENDGYKFINWYLDSDYNTPATEETLANRKGYTTLYSRWEYPIEITYNSVGGTISGVAGRDYTAQGYYPIVDLVLPTPVSSYSFIGWYFDNKYEQPATVEAIKALKQNNITLYARWAKPIKVTYNSGTAVINGEADVDYDTTFRAGSSPVLPTATDANGTWSNWYFDAEFTKPANSDTLKLVNSDVTLYLRGEKKYTIVYNLNGGTITSTDYSKEYVSAWDTTSSLVLPAIVKDGYKFLGWYVDPEFETPATYSSMLAIRADAFLYPQFVDQDYFVADVVGEDEAPKVNTSGNSITYFEGVNLTQQLKDNGTDKFTFRLETATEGNVEWASESLGWNSGFGFYSSATKRQDLVNNQTGAAQPDGKFDEYSQTMRFIIFKKEDVPTFEGDTESGTRTRYGMYAGSHLESTHIFLTEMGSGATIDVVFDMTNFTMDYYVDGELVLADRDMNTHLNGSSYTEGLLDINHLNYSGVQGTTYEYDGKVYTRSNRNYMIRLEADGRRVLARRDIGIYAYDIYGEVTEETASDCEGPIIPEAAPFATEAAEAYTNGGVQYFRYTDATANWAKDDDGKLLSNNHSVTYRFDTANKGSAGWDICSTSWNTGIRLRNTIYARFLIIKEGNLYAGDHNVGTHVFLTKMNSGAVVDVVFDIANQKVSYYVDGVLTADMKFSDFPTSGALFFTDASKYTNMAIQIEAEQGRTFAFDGIELYDYNIYASYIMDQTGHVIGTYHHGVNSALPEAPSKEGYVFAGYYTDDTFTTELPEEDAFIPAYATGNKTVYVKWNGTNIVDQFGYVIGTYNLGEETALPVAPTKSDCVFGGYYTDATLTTELTAEQAVIAATASGHQTVYIKWTANIVDQNGYKIGTYVLGQETTLPAAPTKEGCKFDGYYTDATFTTEFTAEEAVIAATALGNQTVYVKWISLHIVDQNGYVIGIYNYGEETPLPNEPAKADHKFGGYYTDDTFTTELPAEQAVIAATASGDQTVYVKWVVLTLPEPVATQGAGKATYGNRYLANSDVTANWAKDDDGKLLSNNHAITYRFDIANTGSAGWDIYNDMYYTGIRLNNGLASSDPSKTTARFLIFKADPNDATKIGLWAGDHNVSTHVFLTKMNSGDVVDVVFDIANQKVLYYVNSALVVEKAFSDFPTSKFFTDANLYINMQIQIEYEQGRTFAFDSIKLYDSNIYSSYIFDQTGDIIGTYIHGVNSTLPETPTKDGYVFVGYYTDDTFTTELSDDEKLISETDSGDKTVYVKYVDVNIYDQNGYLIGTYNYGEETPLPAFPAKDGYNFGGYYTDATLTTELTAEQAVISATTEGPKTVYVKWNKLPDAISTQGAATAIGKTNGSTTFLSGSAGLGEALKTNSSTSFTIRIDTAKAGNALWEGNSYRGLRLLYVKDDGNNGSLRIARFLDGYIATYSNNAANAYSETNTSGYHKLAAINSGAIIDIVVDTATSTLSYYVDGEFIASEAAHATLPTDVTKYNRTYAMDCDLANTGVAFVIDSAALYATDIYA